MATSIAHTTSQRSTRFEVPIRVHFLREGVFDIQNMITVQHAKYIRKLGKLTDAQLQMIVNVVRLWLHL